MLISAFVKLGLLLLTIFMGSINVLYRSWPRWPSYFPLMESNQRSSHIDASTLPAGSLRFFRASHIAKAKPSFPPYARPADMTSHRSFFDITTNIVFKVSRTASDEIRQNNDGLSEGKGIAMFAKRRALSERSRAKVLQPVVLTDLQGKGPVRKEAFLLT